MTTPAPEPVEVPAAELAAADPQSNRTSELFMRMIAQKVSNPTTRRHIEAYMAEYDRRRMLLDGEYQRGYTDGYLCGSGDRDETLAERDHLREHLSRSCSLTEYDRVNAELTELRKNSIPLYAPTPEQEIRVEFDDE